MMHADFDPGLAAVIGLVREIHGPIEDAITKGGPVSSFDAAALAGAVGALLNAIDARTTPTPALALKAVS
ncbi:hypothetical protein M2155_000672 [Streptomyces sp. SAI-119]|uniref:hypothetical protein n=1 Tax=Streptomyces sp. SAI-119 TaxID=2940541 RepID=UPI00247717AE|nr:hypothetical protein [Streptomyces sp. SAI-119]MDH6448264.1 hypothetical protein [Streptomyces sp. SAI-119]